MFPILLITDQLALAVTHTSVTVSCVLIDAKDPPVPAVVVLVPKKMVLPAFCAIFHPNAVLIPVIETISPTALVEGKVIVKSPALFAIVPVLTAIVASTVTTDHVCRPPFATGKTPDTEAVKLTSDHVGVAAAPALVKT